MGIPNCRRVAARFRMSRSDCANNPEEAAPSASLP